MPRRFLRKFMPSADQQAHQSRWGKLLHNPYLWHLNRHAVARAICLGVFWSFFPLPFGQTLFATLLAIRLRANLPIVILFTWINNPITFAPFLLLAYSLGHEVLRQPPLPDFQPTWHWVEENHHNVWLPWTLGSLMLSFGLSIISYILSQQIWKWRVRRRWRLRRRQLKRSSAAAPTPAKTSRPAQVGSP